MAGKMKISTSSKFVVFCSISTYELKNSKTYKLKNQILFDKFRIKMETFL